MEIQHYGDWSLRFHEREADRRIPLSGTLELTRRCNQACAHCYNNLPVDDRASHSSELTFEEWRRILDEIAAAGCLWLLLTGGEIFLRPDLLDIYAHARRKGLLITLFTNATLVTPAIADALAVRRPFSIEISLYGHTRETHERITGVPGSYEATRRGIRLLLERGLNPIVKTMVMRQNRHELRDMRRMVEEEMGLEFRYDTMLNPRIDGSPDPLRARLSPEEIVALDLEDPRRRTEWVRFCRDFPGPAREGNRRDALFDCGGGWQSFAIDPEGRLSNCLLWTRQTYDLRQGSFQDGWEIFLAEQMERKARRKTPCSACGIKDMCGMCPANGVLECRDPEEPVDFLCRVAHLRAYALDIPVPPHGDCAYCKEGAEYDTLRTQAEALLKSRAKPVAGPQPLAASGALLRDLASDLLGRGYEVRFRAPGQSMHPVIRKGEPVIVRPVAPSAVRRGDIVLYRWREGVIAHRVAIIEKAPGGDFHFLVRGDAAGARVERVAPDRVLGKVIAAERNGRRVDPYSIRSQTRRFLQPLASRCKQRMPCLKRPLRPIQSLRCEARRIK